MNRYFLTSTQTKNEKISAVKSHQSFISMPKISRQMSSQRSSKFIEAFEKSYNPEEVKLPSVSLKKVLSKIGALSGRQSTYVPPQQEQKLFRTNKIKQLKQFYPFGVKKRSGDPFKFQLDEIVLDCYKYGESHGKKTVWRKYRKNLDALSFDTMRVLKKK